MLETKTNADRASTPVTISAFNYGVNNLGQRTGVSTSGSAFAGGYSLGWAYNASGELKEEDFGANQTSDTRDRAFQYDAIGNREKTANGLLAGLPATPNYAANGLNQYTVANGITLPTTPAPHDADGNAKARNIRNPLAIGSSSLASCSFTWDAENRLTEVKDSGGNVIATYAYDFQSRRIRKTVASGEDVAFFYEGWNCIAEYQVGGASTPQVRYTWGQDLSGSMQGAGGVGGLLIVKKSANSYYPTYDGNGNVSEYLNSSGAGVVHFEYDAFGNVVNFTESSVGLAATFRHRFSTKPQDGETGLLYYGYRYYDPVTGRWPSRDPIEEEGGLNLYAFVSNNAIVTIDILGELGVKPDSKKAQFYADVDYHLNYRCTCDSRDGEVTKMDLATCESFQDLWMSAHLVIKSLPVERQIRKPGRAKPRPIRHDFYSFLTLEVQRQVWDLAEAKCEENRATGRCTKFEVIRETYVFRFADLGKREAFKATVTSDGAGAEEEIPFSEIPGEFPGQVHDQ